MAWVAHTTDRSVLDYGFKYFYEYSPVGIFVSGRGFVMVPAQCVSGFILGVER